MQLSAYATSRDNNFNLVRFLAAFAVLWSHSYALVLGPQNHEPWVNWLGYTPAGIAVDVFFVTSGFLVTASLLRLDDFKAFVRARALRIFPALIVMSLLLALAMGPVFSTLPLDEYFASSTTWKFIVKNATILTGVKYKLPGVFDGQPMDEVINGSLWTLPFELRCYLTLALVWWAAKFAKSAALRSFTRMLTIGTALMLLSFWVAHAFGYKHWHTFRLFYMFFCGAVFWVFRERIPLKGWIAVAMAIALAVGVAMPKYFFWVYPLTVPYLILWMAYVPGGFLRRFNRFGDYSYGIYIYAFPAQQMLIASVPGITPEQMILAATVVTLPLAMLSWHFVEKPMLARKRGGAKH
jgi:peptidoglycan/LPS O-acetylase OafA/YrhL